MDDQNAGPEQPADNLISRPPVQADLVSSLKDSLNAVKRSRNKSESVRFKSGGQRTARPTKSGCDFPTRQVQNLALASGDKSKLISFNHQITWNGL
jgi:hypothetical protein